MKINGFPCQPCSEQVDLGLCLCMDLQGTCELLVGTHLDWYKFSQQEARGHWGGEAIDFL